MKVNEVIVALKSGAFDKTLSSLYGEGALKAQKSRYETAASKFSTLFGNKEVRIFSVPARTELSGNHTDHNGGKTLASAINIDLIGIASTDAQARLKGGGNANIDVSNLSVVEKDKGSAASLARGVLDAFSRCGLNYGGFNLYTLSDIKSGTGISSSAAFSVLIGLTVSKLYNEGAVSPLSLAIFAKYAENVHFGKACGLMDQIACAFGGTVYIDFKREDYPLIKNIEVDFSKLRRKLYLVDTGSSHRALSDYYSEVSSEMKSVAWLLSKERLCDIPEKVFLSKAAFVLRECGDRAFLRAIHFYGENERVEAQMNCLEKGDFEEFLKLVRGSGDSSFKFLQNIYAVPEEQRVAVAIALAEKCGAVARVHGGGFGGNIQCYVEPSGEAEFLSLMKSVFGEDSCLEIVPGRRGAVEVSGEGLS